MGYRITYGQNIIKTDLPIAHNAASHKKWIYVAITCVLLIVALFSGQVRRFFLPGDPDVTEKALSELIVDLREGDTVSDAVTAFCREILANA